MQLDAYETAIMRLPSLAIPNSRDVLLDQLIDSERRTGYFRVLATRDIDVSSCDPTNVEAFDPLRGSIYWYRVGKLDEALWLLYLYVHFGKHSVAGWRYPRMVYARAGEPGLWDWESVSRDPAHFRDWLDANQADIEAAPGRRGFGNHRKYESLNARRKTGTGFAIQSYVDWVHSFGNHSALEDWLVRLSSDPQVRFAAIYKSMGAVARFGRTARFDYLATAGRLGILPIEPGLTYLTNASGPLDGARLLFASTGAATHPRALEARLVEFARYLNVGAEVIEDALCNWQKDPTTYVYFRG